MPQLRSINLFSAKNQNLNGFRRHDHDHAAKGVLCSMITGSIHVWQHIDSAKAVTSACRSMYWYHSDPAALATLGKMET